MLEALTCFACKKDQTTITDPESGEIICSNCGIVILERTEDFIHSERRAYSMEEIDNRSRTGDPTSLAIHDRGLCTTISKVNKDANGKIIDAAMLPQIKKLRRRAFQKLDTLKDKLGLSDTIVEKTAYIFRKVHERQLIRGRTVDGMLAAQSMLSAGKWELLLHSRILPHQ